MKFTLHQYTYLVIAPVLALALACTPITTTQASSHNQVGHAIDTVASQILLAHSLGDTQEVTQLFSVLFQLLYIDDGFGAGVSSGSGLDLEDIEVHNIEEDEADASIELDWNGSENAWIWFEYGEDEDDLEYETSRARIDEDDDDFEDTLEDLDEDERYYVRAVAEDRDTDELYYSGIESFRTDDEDDDDDEPSLDIESADDVQEDSAVIAGEVDMNDFRNGIVFFVWGEDEDQVEDIADDYDEYRDIDEEGDDLQKRRVDSDLDDEDDYSLDIDNLDDDTRHYASICVEYEDEDDDETIVCSKVEDFRTDD
jgi:hypothetical protein